MGATASRMNLLGHPGEQQSIKLQEITNENRACLVKRWNAAQKSVEETMHRYDMPRSQVEKLAILTYEQVELLAGMGYSLLTLSCDERTLDLARRAESSQELSRLMVLRG